MEQWLGRLNGLHESMIAIESPEERIRCSVVGWVRMHRQQRALFPGCSHPCTTPGLTQSSRPILSSKRCHPEDSVFPRGGHEAIVFKWVGILHPLQYVGLSRRTTYNGQVELAPSNVPPKTKNTAYRSHTLVLLRVGFISESRERDLTGVQHPRSLSRTSASSFDRA